MQKLLEESSKLINERLTEYLNLSDNDYNILYNSMQYSALSDGKRIRPFIALEFYKLFSTNIESVIPFACCLELIHAYSLIHDDLPCMDNDDMRRGKPSNHKAFGEAVALLSGDALLTLAFGIAAENEYVSERIRMDIIRELSVAAGHKGMIGGQVMDMLYENKDIDIVRLIKMHTLKTGNMIMAASRIGCRAGLASEEHIDAATMYAKNIGLAFQVIDDILDVRGDSAVLGKNTGSDKNKNKFTFVKLLGEDQAFEYAKTLTSQAVAELDLISPAKTAVLKNLAEFLLYRGN